MFAAPGGLGATGPDPRRANCGVPPRQPPSPGASTPQLGEQGW